MEHVTVNQNMKPTLLTLLREMRDQIYGYFLTIDRSAEYITELEGIRVFDLIVLTVSRQMREEVLDVLKTTNLSVHLRVVHEDVDDRAARPLLQSLLQYLQPVLCTGHLDMSAVQQNANLEIIVAKGDLPESTNPIDSHAIYFAYGRMTYARLSESLWNNMDKYDILVVGSEQSSVPKGLDTIKTFLRPLGPCR